MVGSRIDQAVNATKLVGALAPLALQMGQKQIETILRGSLGVSAGEDGRETAGVSRKAPPTRFNGPLSPHRVVDAIPLPFAEIQKIRDAVPGATINDVFVSVSGGTVRKYLLAKGELPEISLNALVPMSIHGEAKSGDAGNQIGMAFVPVFSNIADAGERLRKVCRGTTKGKKAVNAVGRDLPARIFQTLPSRAVDFAVRHVLLPQFNFTVSNVRGPATALYMAGARVHAFMPVNMLLDGMGLNITGFSYNGVLWVCAVSDRAMMPDPGFFMDCFRESFAEHLALALRAPAAEARPARRTARKAAPVAQASHSADQPVGTKPVRQPPPQRKPRAATAAPE
jgi:WS/DGAT/MGAT family acyltransferase